jgi:hypothetical protein
MTGDGIRAGRREVGAAVREAFAVLQRQLVPIHAGRMRDEDAEASVRGPGWV